MAYEKTVWVNGQSPALDADHLNKIEQGIADAVSVTAQTLSDGQKAQARGNISAMQGIESTDHPGCYYVLNGSAVEWVNPPMLNDVDYATTERYKGNPVHRGLLGDFEVWGCAAFSEVASTGKPIVYNIGAGETKNISLKQARTYIFSASDNARAGVAIVQCGNQNIKTITPLVPLANWKIEAGSGLSINVTEQTGTYLLFPTAMML